MKNILLGIGLIIFLIASSLLFVIYFNYDNTKDAKDRFQNNYYMFGYWSAYCLYMMGALVLGLSAFSAPENE